jgi:hypothetical protein
MQKYQGNSTNAPRETFINDQRHMLAYINPFEEDLLRNYGGTGQKGPGGVPAFPPASIESAMDRNYNSNQAAGTQNTSSRSPTARADLNSPADRSARVASTAQAERDNGVNDRDRDPNPGYSGGSGKSISSVNRDNEANRIAAQNEAAKRAQQEQTVKNKDRAKNIALGTALDIERKKALAGGHSYFKSSDGKFYTTDPNAPKELQDALAQRSVAYTPEANPKAFNADGTPRGGIFGFANFADMFDMGGPRASGNTYSGGPLAGYGNALGMKPLGMSDEDWEKTKAQQQLMKESKMGAFAQRPDFSKYPETGFPDPAQSTDGFGGDSYQGGGDNQVAAPAPEPIIDPCPEGYVLKEGACVLDTSTTIPGFPSLTPPLPQGPTVVGNPGYTPVGGGVAPRLNPYPQQMPIMAPPPGLAGAQVGEAGILDLLRAANR